MSGLWHPSGRARVSQRQPEAQAVCDRCYCNWSLNDLSWQFQWAGTKLQNLRLLVCPVCLDVPQPALKTIIIPPDPVPRLNPRPEQYSETVPNDIATEPPAFLGNDLTTETGDDLIWEIGDTPLPDPNKPVIYYPDTASST